MTDADVPLDPWGNPIPEGVRPPNRPPAAQDPAPDATRAPVPPSAAEESSNPAWPGRSRPTSTGPTNAPSPPLSSLPPPPPAWPSSGGSGTDAWLPPPPAARPKVAGTAVSALVCGITSILCTGFVGIVLGPTALGLGLAARRRIRASNGWRTGEGMATAGIVCGIIGILLSIVYVVFLIRNPNFIGDFLEDLTSTTTTDRLQNA